MSNWRGKSLWSVSSRLIGAGLAFALNVLLTHTVSRSDMGLFFLSLSVAWGGALVCQCGTSILAVKWVATSRALDDQLQMQTRRAIWSLVQFTVIQGIFVSAFFFFAPRPMEMRIIWGLWTLAISLQTLLPEILRGFDDLKWASLLGGPIPQLFGVIVVGAANFIWKQATFQQVAYLSIFASFATSAVGIFLILSRAPFIFKTVSYSNFMREAAPIGLSLAATYALSQADLWVCGALLRHEDVAVYGIAQRFNAFVSMPLMIFGSVATPTMAELFATRDMGRLKDMIYRGTFVTTIFTLLVLVGGVVVAWPAMYYLIGRDYTASYPIFLLLGLGQFIHAFSGPNGYLLLLCGEQRAAMTGTIISAIILFFAALLLGRIWGAPGIAAASAFSLSLQSAWMWYQVRKRLNFNSQFRWVPNWGRG